MKLPKPNPEVGLKYILYNALKLSEKEKAVIGVIEKQKMARNITEISSDAQIPRSTTAYIMKKLLKWRIVREVNTEKRVKWMFNKQLNYFGDSAPKFDYNQRRTPDND
jgi:predicted transcriptional regulator